MLEVEDVSSGAADGYETEHYCYLMLNSSLNGESKWIVRDAISCVPWAVSIVHGKMRRASLHRMAGAEEERRTWYARESEGEYQIQ